MKARNKKPPKPRTTRTKFEMERDRAIIARLYLAGKFQSQIPELLQKETGAVYRLSQQVVSKDLIAVEKRWEASANESIEKLRMQQLAKVDELERQAWDMFEKSKSPFISTTVKARRKGKKKKGAPGTDEGPGPDDTFERIERTDERIGNVQYWNAIMDCVKRRMELLPGLAAPIETRQEITITLPEIEDTDED